MAGLFSFVGPCYTNGMPFKRPSLKVRVRFAPSPTGFLHIGSLRTALYDYLFAKKYGGEFILRIEDTDRTRLVEGGMESITRTLEWAGIKWDEGPYAQSERLDIYKKYAEQLLKNGSAYACTCSPERLEQVRQEQIARKEMPRYDRKCRYTEIGSPLQQRSNLPHVIRLKIPEQGSTTFRDIIRGEVAFENALIDDQVLLKSDGFPTYHLANVVDDHLMKITHVIRGEEWLSSTPKHVLLYKAFKWRLPQFAHLPLLLNADHSKLSKRQGDVAVEDYIKKGYLPEALLNFVALLGFNPRADKELYTVDELIGEFDLTKVNKAGAVVNFEKLDWMNGQYIRQKSLDELVELALPYLGVENRELAKKILALERERLKKLSDLKEATEFFFVEQPRYEPGVLVWKKMAKKDVANNLEGLREFLQQYSSAWEASTLEAQIKAWITKTGRGVGETLWPMRVALSGRAASPPPFEITEILGKARTLARLEYAIKVAKKM